MSPTGVIPASRSRRAFAGNAPLAMHESASMTHALHPECQRRRRKRPPGKEAASCDGSSWTMAYSRTCSVTGPPASLSNLRVVEPSRWFRLSPPVLDAPQVAQQFAGACALVEHWSQRRKAIARTQHERANWTRILKIGFTPGQRAEYRVCAAALSNDCGLHGGVREVRRGDRGWH